VNDVALSRNGRHVLRGFFFLVVAFLYAPILILLVFSFNNSDIPAFPLSGFTLHWYHEFLVNGDLRASLETSAIIAVVTSIGAVMLGVLSSIALTRKPFRGKALVSALLLSPLVIPYLVFGIALLLLFHTIGIPNGIPTVVIGHIVITLPYTILVLVPRLEQIDVALADAAYDLGAGRFSTFRLVTLPLILPAVLSAFLIAFTTSFDEYAVASFLVGTRATFPIYLYSALRFPSQLPQVIAVAVVVLVVSLTLIACAEIGRRVVERRVGGSWTA
jgi:spermidine/putrescine transport system permease protein